MLIAAAEERRWPGVTGRAGVAGVMARTAIRSDTHDHPISGEMEER
jgi:hypothetical protein